MTVESHEPEHLREILHEQEYIDSLSSIFQNARRADEVLEGLELYLSRRAELGMAMRGYPDDHATWLSKPLPNGSRVRVFYQYDDELVTMLDAWLVPFIEERDF